MYASFNIESLQLVPQFSSAQFMIPTLWGTWWLGYTVLLEMFAGFLISQYSLVILYQINLSDSEIFYFNKNNDIFKSQ